MIAVRQLLTGIGIGVLTAVAAHQLFEHGLNLQLWSVRDPLTGRMIVIGALIGAISQIAAPSRGRR